SRASQLLSDLIALEQAARVIEPLSRIQPPELYRAMGELQFDIARVHLAWRNETAASAAADLAVAYLDGVGDGDKDVRASLVGALMLKADLLKRRDAHAGALAACDRSIAFAEHLAADHDAATELVADALTAKIKVLVHIDENLHDCHRLVMDLHN